MDYLKLHLFSKIKIIIHYFSHYFIIIKYINKILIQSSLSPGRFDNVTSR